MNKKSRIINYIIEFILVVILSSVAIVINMDDLIFAPNNFYPVTADAMGHLAKVRYLAECFKSFHFPSWYPYWYSGSTVMQYYPPLSYLFMTPIQMITNNVMITYKIFCFLSFFIGSIGVWFFCRRCIGRWCGIFGAIIYSIEPFMTRSLLGAGVLAQGTVFMISPWFIYTTVRFAVKPSRKLWFANCIFTALLIFSHAMHAFMVCLCIMVVLLVFVVIKKLELKHYILLVSAMGFGAMLTAGWALPGSTKLENPTIPYLLEEAALQYTATLDWYSGFNKAHGSLYFDIPLQIVSVSTVLLYIIYYLKRKNIENRNLYASFNLAVLFFTLFFSFGRHIPFFSIVPMYRNLVPGRILSLSAVCVSIAGGQLVYMLYKIRKSRFIGFALSFIAVTAIIAGINPLSQISSVEDVEDLYNRIMTKLDAQSSNFDKGRYCWLASVNCRETYFPTVYNFNTTDGWNIEGSPHNTAIWLHNIAIVADCGDYVIKNILSWNVRSLLIDKGYGKIVDSLINRHGFKQVDGYKNFLILKSDDASSYYNIDKRDSIVIGIDGDGMAMEFPWLVRGTKPALTDYSTDELRCYKNIYFNEPKLDSMKDVKRFENLIHQLVADGKNIFIETNANQNYPIFGVSSFDMQVDTDMALTKTKDCMMNCSVDNFKFNRSDIFRGLVGLDKVYYTLNKENSTLINDVIGEKQIDEGKIYFIGMTLSQYLTPSQIKRIGYIENDPDYMYYKPIREIMESILDLGNPNKDYMYDKFPITNQTWDYNSGEFKYSSDKDQDVTVSLTYAPRWKVKLDGKVINTTNRENLILLNLPVGNHEVTLDYENTWVGKLGYAFCIIAVVCIIIILIFYNIIVFWCYKLIDIVLNYLQMITLKKPHEINANV